MILDSLIEKGIEEVAEFVVKLIPDRVLEILDDEKLEKALDQAVAAIHAMDGLSNDAKRDALAQQIREICEGYDLADRMVDLLGSLIYNKFRLKLGF